MRIHTCNSAAAVKRVGAKVRHSSIPFVAVSVRELSSLAAASVHLVFATVPAAFILALDFNGVGVHELPYLVVAFAVRARAPLAGLRVPAEALADWEWQRQLAHEVGEGVIPVGSVALTMKTSAAIPAAGKCRAVIFALRHPTTAFPHHLRLRGCHGGPLCDRTDALRTQISLRHQ